VIKIIYDDNDRSKTVRKRGTMGHTHLFSHMTTILTSNHHRVWWLPGVGFALPLSLSRGQWYADDRATTETAGMLASSGGCSKFLKRTDVNVGKYGGHCRCLGTLSGTRAFTRSFQGSTAMPRSDKLGK
jgi:hypothetical protein